MSTAERWIIGLLAALLVIALLAFARGNEERGADTTPTTVTTDEVATTSAEVTPSTTGP